MTPIFMKSFPGSEDIGYTTYHCLNSCDSPFKIVGFFPGARPTALLPLLIKKRKFAEAGNLPTGLECKV
jgi:hypothetical protein